MKGNKHIWILILTAWCAAGCRKPYAPPVITNNKSYLVVEGNIDSGSDSTIITLSTTVNLNTHDTTTFQSGAQVSVEAEGGVSMPLQEQQYQPGRYYAAALNLDKTKKYRLHIVMPGNEYVSDYEGVKVNPPIDSVNYKIGSKGLQIFSNTHDPANNTRYYRWAYEEAWRFHSAFNSGLVVKNGAIVPRSSDEGIYYCYAGDRSSTIILASSAKLTQDVIFENPVILIPPNSEKLGIKYSILLKQYALTKAGYDFWENIKKNTEQLGSIFDAQPSQLVGNIHSVTHPNETVIGYISVTNMQSKRIYISSSALPASWQPDYKGSCELDSALFQNPNSKQNDVKVLILEGPLIPITTILKDSYVVLGYTASTLDCVDCRLRGKTEAPPFWTE
ncbi:DUF4249 domain-containing protein [Mucilaginibacter ginsenosidivorax]|uniref:DUF4249 domain-containing protein n=1 Tax=Mucilaginibacter ginsenosidivorax TaxID=862126 RepID=A0A5B8VZT8_9SPHI|nr:DUF4249 domain-containing protein [Mucilaginibacter ginsenosidivorax]QEC76923.1 DUF4249 domain-containing protein [Mucilaginibacter ginsenosidivorax]